MRGDTTLIVSGHEFTKDKVTMDSLANHDDEGKFFRVRDEDGTEYDVMLALIAPATFAAISVPDGNRLVEALWPGTSPDYVVDAWEKCEVLYGYDAEINLTRAE